MGNPLTLRVFVSISASVALAGSAGATTFFSEDFESLADGALNGQGGWVAHPDLDLDSTNNLGTRVQDGIDIPGPIGIATADHPVTITPGTTELVVSADVYGKGGSSPVTHNGGFFIQNSGGGNALSWFYDNLAGDAWKFSGTAISLPNFGLDQPIRLSIHIDRDAGMAWGSYDAGGANTGTTAQIAYSAAQFDTLDTFRILQDYRNTPGFTGIEVDNILVATPEPSAAFFLLGGIASLALRRRR